jgi:hypothetical protein
MHCILDGESQTGYGRRHNMTEQTVNDAILKIRKKAAGYLL